MPATIQHIRSADARDMRDVPDESVDLVITSPPYPMIEMWDAAFAGMNPAITAALQEEHGERAFALMHEELDRAWDEVVRVLRPGGIVCVNVGDATRTMDGTFRLHSNHVRILDALERRGLHSLPHILWRKQTNAPNKFMGSGMLPPGAYVTLEHEHILILRKVRQRLFPDPEDKARRRRSAFFWEERNSWFSDVWDFKGARQNLDPSAPRERSGAFPFELAYRLVAMFSVQGDKVLDPFVGTGTTILACAALGRNGIGVEIDASLVARAREALLAAADSLNAWTTTRLNAHVRFVRERVSSGKEVKHVNEPHGFAVMTAQETDLCVELVHDIVPAGTSEARVSYSRGAPGELP